MTGKCEICGMDAPFFTEIYNPQRSVSRTVYLCKEHQSAMIRAFNRWISNQRVEMKKEFVIE